MPYLAPVTAQPPPLYQQPVATVPPPPPPPPPAPPQEAAPVEQQVAAPPQQAAPVEQAPPQQQAQTILSTPGTPAPAQQAPPSETILSTPGSQPVQPQAEQPTGPVSTGRAADALGATVAQIPALAAAAPSTAVNVAKAAPGAVGEFVSSKNPRTYQPAAPGVQGESQALHQQAEAERTAAAQAVKDKVLGGDLGQMPNLLGAVKDVELEHIASNVGEFTPYGPEQRKNIIEATVYARDHNGVWPEWATKCPVVGPNGTCLSPSLKDTYGNSMFTEIINSPDENFSRSYKEGYTAPDGTVYAPGWEATWNYFQDGQGGAGKAAADLVSDPKGAVVDLAGMVLSGGGEALAKRGAEEASRYAVEQGGKTALKATAKQVVGKGMQAADRLAGAGYSMGLSEAVPAAFKGAKAGYEALPWLARQTTAGGQRVKSEALQQMGEQTLAARRSGAGQQGVPDLTMPSQITRPTPDKNIYRTLIPPDMTGAGGVDLTYHVDKKGKLDGVYDVAVPGPADRYRPITEADAQTIYETWGKLGDADRQVLRQAAYPALTKLETAPNEPFIDPGADVLRDRAGNIIADTGRAGTGSERARNDLRDTILRSGRPDQIVTDFTDSWEKTLYDYKVHPLTRRTLAEHRLQTLRDVLDSLPASYRTPEIEAHYRQMRDMLPKDAPSVVGTGQRWRGPITAPTGAGAGPPGGWAPLARKHQAWLRELSTLPPDQFNRSGVLDKGRVGHSNGLNIIYDHKPSSTAPAALQNGYATYMDLMDFRLHNPPMARREVAALKGEVNGLRLSPTGGAASREAAIKDALETSGVIPGATGMTTDELAIAIDNHLRLTRPSFPPLPGTVPTPPHGIFPPGSEDERWGLSLAPKQKEAMERTIDVGGVRRTAGDLLFGHWQDTETAYVAAKRLRDGIPLAPPDEKHLTAQLNTIKSRFPGEYKNLTAEQLGAMKPGEIDRLSAALLKSDMQISQGVRSSTGKMLTPGEMKGAVGKALGVYDQFISMWRSVVLYNVGRGIQYPMLQLAGNTMSGLIAAREALPFYLDPVQLKRSWNYLRDPETELAPEAIRIRDKLGLGRTQDLGRGSKDQLGARTGFNQEDSHGLTKAFGAVLGNQRVKDMADSMDQGWRLSLWREAFEPSFNRLKKDLVPMAVQRFQNMGAARGIPFNVTTDQIDRTIKQLDVAEKGYFDQPQLRQALYEMGGGSAAPNRQALWDVSDRIARDYKHEYDQLDELAINKVNHVAFGGGDTNASAALQRGFMFTWWVGNASRQFAIEAAKSPIQMGIWGRMIHDSQRQEATGTSPAYNTFVQFMATPAGYTVAFNKYSLLGTWLLGNSADPSDERSNLTALGQFMNGAVGDNLILSPILQGLSQVLGAQGQDARTPDILGTNRLEKEINDGLNAANQLMGGFYQTKGGNPEHIPQLGIGPGFVNKLAQVFSGMLPGTQKVGGYDPNAGFEAQMTSLIADQIIRDNPDLDPNDVNDAETIEQGVNKALIDHDSPAYQEALGRYTEGQYAGPGTTGEGGWRDVLGAVTSHWVLPTSFSRQPTLRDERNQRMNRDALRKEGSQTLDPTAEATAFDKKLGSLSVKSKEGRDLALVRDEARGDPITQATVDMKNAIMFGELEKVAPEVTVDGFTFTAAQIAALPEEDRQALANRWVAASGAKGTMDAYYENRDAQLKADKRYADGEGLPKYSKQYPGGVDRFVDDTAQINPNYKRFIESTIYDQGEMVNLPDLRVTDHARWTQLVTQFEQAKNVIAGVKDSRYGLEIDPKYAGMVAGLDKPVGAWLLEQNEAAGSVDSDYTATMKGDYETMGSLGAALDQLDAQWGQPIGTNKATMVQRIMNGEEYPVDIATRDALTAMTGGIDTTLDNPKAMAGYIAWNMQQPAGADASIDAYNQAYFAQKDQQRVQELAALLATGQAPQVGPDGKAVTTDPFANLVLSGGTVSPGVRAAQDVLNSDAMIVSEPGGVDGIQVPAGMPLLTAERMSGSDGSVWVHVTEPNGGIDGWVDANTLGAGVAPVAPVAAPVASPNGAPPAAPSDYSLIDTTSRRLGPAQTPSAGINDPYQPGQGDIRSQVAGPTVPSAAPVAPPPAPATASAPWYEQAGGALGSMSAGVAGAVGGLFSGLIGGASTSAHSPTSTAPAAPTATPSTTPVPEPTQTPQPITVQGLKAVPTATKTAVVAPPGSHPGKVVTPNVTGQQIANLADDYAGVEYVHEFPTKDDDPYRTGWDCSSFVHWVADNMGISEVQLPNGPGYVGGGVPVGSHFQYQWATANNLMLGTDLSVAQPGDLIFFSTDPTRQWCDPHNWNGCMNNDASHVGIYLGPGQNGNPTMINAEAPGIGTVFEDLTQYPYPILGIARIT